MFDFISNGLGGMRRATLGENEGRSGVLPSSSAEGETPAQAEEIDWESSVLRRCDGREGGKADVGVAGMKVTAFSSSGLYFLAEIEAALCPGGAVVG